ncbi:antitoxin PaaA2 family protein, partial [Pseudomonas amygdali]
MRGSNRWFRAKVASSLADPR